MATKFPTSIDTKVNPTSTELTNQPADTYYGAGHAAEHIFANDAIKAIEAKLGVDGSRSTTAVDYKLALVTGTQQAASKQYVDNLVYTANPFFTHPAYYLATDSVGGDLQTFLAPVAFTISGNVIVFKNSALAFPGVNADYQIAGQNIIFNNLLYPEDTVAIFITNSLS